MAQEPTKVVLRLLPPLITEDELLSTLPEEHVKNASIRTFIAGKRYKGQAKPSRNALCYFYYSNLEHAEALVREYHGHQFVDDQGEQFRAVACFAPYQKVPKQKVAKDPREGTIQDDASYKEWVENLTKPKEKFEAPDNHETSSKPEAGQTPLLLFLAARAKERRARVEKRQAKKWAPQGDSIEEDWDSKDYSSGRKAKWRCGECGSSKNLEEDPDERGCFYCTRCWESWETAATSKPKKKKKKKYEEEEVYEEPTSRKSRRKREKEAAAAADAEWYANNATKDEEEEDDGKKPRRKKKDKEADSWKESEGGDAGWWKDDGTWSAKKEKKSRSKRDKDEKWVAKDDTTEKRGSDESEAKSTRWKKKGESAEGGKEEASGEKEEKPDEGRKGGKGRNRRDKPAKDEWHERAW